MATDQRTLDSNLATDAAFRAWGSGLSAQFAAIGLVKTADTGQIDWSTVLKPSAADQQRGYEIWRFNDALQATKPVFIRIDFGSSSAIVNPSLWLNVGTGTNGAGTLTGQVGTQKQAASGGTGSSLPCYCSGSSSRLNLAANWTAAGAAVIMICVERTKTAAGVDTGDGIVRWIWGPTAGGLYQLVPFVGAIPSQANNPALESNAGGLAAVGADVVLLPTVAFYGKPLFASWCVYANSQITALIPITFSHLGATRTYMPLGQVVSSHVTTTASGYALAMLWE